ncbi:biotin/lipoate A/B protein ligase family protein [Methylacidimicrobium sp. B4]|uniref:lipoate--protein ligase family protein n=1 Tax=Methylacidimicrobium sp. B4 TaxID=2796139 RepID=UPI001A8DB639|nr:biotin/lipoate A/B protein ligase family protein [Methylacidimicrobium sp. B4]QSR84243.1 lipoate--protein ligase family protein [Methylacidimicrobium sp. B4]
MTLPHASQEDDGAVRWRLLRHGPGRGAWNMAVDEALLRSSPHPLLRIYEWEEDAVSIGYFQPWEEAPAGRPFVRRWTGGGLVDHAADLTYTVIVPRSHPVAHLSTLDAYRLFHAAVCQALLSLGCSAELATESDGGPSTRCFARPVRFDVMREGKKVAGGAQRRTREGLLHQGSILWPEEAERSRIAAALPWGLACSIGAHLLSDELTPEELRLAARLERERYATDSWNRQW